MTIAVLIALSAALLGGPGLSDPRPSDPALDVLGAPSVRWGDDAATISRALGGAEVRLDAGQQRSAAGRPVSIGGCGFSLAFHGHSEALTAVTATLLAGDPSACRDRLASDATRRYGAAQRRTAGGDNYMDWQGPHDRITMVLFGGGRDRLVVTATSAADEVFTVRR